MARSLGLGSTLAAVWLLLSGHYTALVLSFGAASVVLVVYLAHRMDVVDHEGVPLTVAARLLVYLPWLLKEIFLANLTVARIVLTPGLPISPAMVIFRGKQKTDVGRFVYANSITLTPGTITTGVEENRYEIHALTTHDLETDEEARMSRFTAWVEGTGP